jgi:predicted peptidase
LIAPQVPGNRGWVEGGRKGKTPDKTRQGSEPGKLVLDLIEQTCKEYPIDRKRIYLTGRSMGGYGTWGLLARKPDLFAAAMPVCGGGDVNSAERLAKIPIWVFHGDKDPAVNVSRSRDMVAAIKKAGGSPKYTEYPGVGHDSWSKTYANDKVLDWLFAQKKD